MLDIKALEKALAVIGNVGKEEFTFEVDGVPVTMRVLTADEDMAVQKYAREGGQGEEEKDDDEGAMSLLERFKRISLAYAIVQVGPVDLRNEDYIATGEVTEAGVPIRVPRVVAVRKIIDGWTRSATLALFQKYLEMVRRADAKAEKAVKFEAQDLDAEIDRVSKRLEELRTEKERAERLRDGSASQATMVGRADQEAADRLRTVVEAAAGVTASEPQSVEATPTPAPAPAPTVVTPTPTPVVTTPPVHPGPPRQRVMPQGAAPPPRPVALPPTPVPAAASPIEGSFDSMQDSMGDSPEAIAAETARLIAARTAARRASMESVASGGEEPIEVPVRRGPPPHRGALNTAEAVLDVGAGDIRATRVSGPVEGVETYRLPPTPVSNRGVGQGGRQKVVLDEAPKVSSNNPRFRGTGRR